MAAKVYGDPRTQGEREHADGTSLDVQDAHLIVLSGAKKIAVYAPGTWQRAEVVTK
jgi:hypothetical protein